MIINREHKFLFIAVPQTGSKAIEKELTAQYGGESILHGHARLQDVTEDLTGYRLICGRRHPLDRLVSTFEKYRGRHDSEEDLLAAHEFGRIHAERFRWVRDTGAEFPDYVRRYHRPWRVRTPEDHTPARPVDHVIRFENLNADFRAALVALGLEPVRDLPLANKTRSKTAGYETYYTPEIGGLVAAVYGPWCEYWGYDVGFLGARVPLLSRTIFRAKMALRSKG